MQRPLPPLKVTFPHRNKILELRAPTPDDVGALVDAIQDSLPALRRFMPWAWLETSTSVEGQLERLVDVQAAYLKGIDYTMHLFEGDTFLGCFGLHRRTMNDRALEIGYWVASRNAGQGIATTTTQMLVTLGFKHFECERIQCGYNKNNVASRKVNERAGFTIEGESPYFESMRPEMLDMGASNITVFTAITKDHLPNLDWFERVHQAARITRWQFC